MQQDGRIQTTRRVCPIRIRGGIGATVRGLLPVVLSWASCLSFQLTQRLRQLPPLVIGEALCLTKKCLGGCAGADLLLNISGKFARRSKQIVRWHAENSTQEDDRVGCWRLQSTVFYFSDIPRIQRGALCPPARG